MFVGAKTDTLHVVVGPAPAQTVTVTESVLLADLRGSSSTFRSEPVKVDGVNHPSTVRTYLNPCGGARRSQSTWTWEGDMSRLVGKLGLTDESFNGAVASLAVYEGNGVNKLLARFPASIDGLTDVDVPLNGIYTMTLVAEADATGERGCTGVTLAFLDAKLERPTSG